jgi:hypothetical protein
MNANVQTINDPWEEAANPSLPSMTTSVWGLCEMSSWFCVLQKGVGKIPFDQAAHKLLERRTAVDIHITPLAEQDMKFDVTRGLIVESKDWTGIVLPSIRDLGHQPRELNGKWVQIELVPTGRTYTNSNGETKTETTLKFIKIYPDEAACRADYKAAKEGTGQTSSTPKPSSPQAAAALAFAKVVVQNVCRGKTDLNVIRSEIATQIAGMPAISQHFTVDSPEILQLIAEAMA